jgi:hypothetical protein
LTDIVTGNAERDWIYALAEKREAKTAVKFFLSDTLQRKG